MNTIKKYQDWLLEKNEADVHTTMGKIDSKHTEKDFSKTLSSNYSKKDGTTSTSNKTEFAPKASKNTVAKTGVDTSPKEESPKNTKPSIEKSNPEKPEKKSFGKVGDVQVSNDTTEKGKVSDKKPHVAEMEEKAKKKTPKLDAVGKEDKDINNDGKVNKSDKFIKNKREKITNTITKEK